MAQVFVENRIHTYKDMLKEAILFLRPQYREDPFFQSLSKKNLIKLYCSIKNQHEKEV